MAQIPMGNFGQSVAGTGPALNVQLPNSMGQAVERVGQVGAGIVNDMAAKETQQREIQARAQSALTLAKTQNDLHDVHDEVARGVLDGSIPTDKAASEFQDRVSKVRGTALEGQLPDIRAQMDAHLETVSGGLQRSLTGVVIQRQQQDTASAIDQYGEQLSREAMRSGPDDAVRRFGAYVDATGPAARLNPQQQAKLKQSFSERVNATFMEQAGLGALTKGDDAALAALREQITGPDGDKLDPARRNTLVHQFFGWEQHIQAQRARDANAQDQEAVRRYNEATDVYNKGTDIALGGGYFSPDFVTEMVTKAQGTEMEKPVAALIGSQARVAGFASKSAPDRQAIIESVRAARATPGLGTDPANEKLISAMENMDNKLRTEVNDNPWAAAQKAGVIQDAQQFNAADPASVISVVQSRMAKIGQIETWAGKKVSPLQPQEVEQLSKMVRSLPIDQETTMLDSLGNSLGDADRVSALAKQLHDKDGSLGLAMLYASSQTTAGKYTAEWILRGDQALKDKSVTTDKAAETGWQATIAKSIRGAYSNREMEDAAIDAAFKITAGKYAATGKADIEEAVGLATGGIMDRNGAKVPLPYGMKQPEFEKRLAAITVSNIAEQSNGLDHVWAGNVSIPLQQFVDSLPSARLVHAGQGRYNVQAGSQLVTNAAGQRIILKVGP